MSYTFKKKCGLLLAIANFVSALVLFIGLFGENPNIALLVFGALLNLFCGWWMLQPDYFLTQKWRQFTMALGLWLIGGRETHNETDLKHSREWWKKEAHENLAIIQKQLEEILAIGVQSDKAIREREEARASSDKHYAKLKEVQNYLDECNSEYKKLAKKHALLKRQTKALRDKLEPPVKRKAKGKK